MTLTDDVNGLLFPVSWQLEGKDSRYFTGTSFLGRGFHLTNLYVKENKLFFKKQF